MTLLYLIAGEASGDVLGARLIAALRARDPDLDFAGVGGERMAEQGFSSLFPMRELALMGLLEVLPRIRSLSRRMDQTVVDIEARRPAAIITIDSPGFTLRVANRVKPLGIPVIHYVAPQVWGWRQGRARKLGRKLDRILALLPFEAPFFTAHGIPVDFVGHPVLESGADRGDAARFRAKHGLAPDERLLIVMPGSRRTEVSRLLPVFGATLALLPPGIRAVVPLAGPVEEAVRAATAHWPRPPILVRDVAEKYDAFAAAEAGLIKSGTSSLECAVAGLPHIVGYRLNPITAQIVKRLMKVRFVSLVNLLAEREVVPEFLQDACNPATLAAALRPLLEGGATRARQLEGFADALGRLRPPEGTPSDAAAEAVLRAIGR
ncbi:lipid-A-disaccharide synthase [Rhodovarius lipocyclicus]|uniref:lipid-A-disaccharide synthase n=1 Tax=Rhodovarius lipocyclicus TaxID=268410 RepID=UPI00135BADD2|nr:lipid-A-disaccharide synthase [Rhodovarius lipocyclicus]